MKHKLLAAITAAFVLLSVNAQAQGKQHCGLASGTGVCTANQGITVEGFYPSEDSLPCIVVGTFYDSVVQFHAPGTAVGYTLQKIAVDSINNFPCGICWAMNNNTVNANSTGCIRAEGLTYDNPGQYLLKIYADVTVLIGGFIPVTEKNIYVDSVADLRYYLRVILPGGSCNPVDTSIPYVTNYTSDSGAINTPSISGTPTICAGASTTLTAGGGNYYGYHWSTGAATAAITVSSAGTYTVTVYGNCNSATGSVNVTLNTPTTPTITPTGPTTFCQGGSVILTSSAGSSYLWSTTATSQSISVTTGGSYTVTVTNASGCTAASSATVVTVNSLPNATVTPSGPLTFCSGGSVTLTAQTGLTYAWSNSTSGQSVNVTATGTYTVTVSNGNCTAASTPITVTVNTNPTASITPNGPTTFCSGDSVILSGPAGLTYAWSNASTTQNITVRNSGSVGLTVTDGNSCTAAATPVMVTVNTSPLATITPNGPTTFCAGGSVMLSAPGGLSYSWSNSTNGQSITVSANGSFTVTVTDGNNCTAASAPTVVTVNANPDATVTPNGPTTFCAGGSVTLTAVPGLSYLWSDNSTGQSLNVTTTGSYSVTVTNGNNCTAVSTPISVTANPNPDASVSLSGPTTFCGSDSLTLTAVAGLGYAWSNSSTSQSITVNQTGSYAVTVTDGNNCTAASTPVNVTVNAVTAFTLDPISQGTCLGGNVTFTAAANGTNVTYIWLVNDANSGVTASSYNIPSAQLSDTGTYQVIANGDCGSDTSTVASLSVTTTITISQQPVSQTACAGTSATFSVIANGSGTTYAWYKDGQPLGGTNATYTINSVGISDTGSYYCQISSSCGDTTSSSAQLTLSQPTYDTVTATICPGSSYNFNGQQETTAGSYTDTLTGSNGCDSIVTLNLSLNSIISNAIAASICDGFSYNFNGVILTSGGTYTDTLVTGGGCDSVVTLTLTVNEPSATSIEAAICAGDSYNFNGVQLTSAGTYYDTLANVNTCDSIITLTLTVNQPSASSISANICSGQSYNFNGVDLTSAGTYYDTLSNGNTCDSIITLTLTVGASSSSSISASICQGTSYNFNGTQLTTGGTYFDTLSNVNGCDSIITLTLQVNTALFTNTSASICDGSSYSFGGQQLTTAGTYYDSLIAQGGCDSIIVLALTVNPSSASSLAASVCAGSNYNFNGQLLNTAGTYYDTLTNMGGCDSIITLTLSVTQPVISNLNVSVCNGSTYNFNGQQLDTAGTYTANFTGANGCDSTVILTLTLESQINTGFSASICQGSSYNFNGQNFTTSGSYNDTLSAQGGCDSIITLTLTVNTTYSSSSNAAICAGSSYNFRGQNLTAAGTYSDTLSTVNGCDSVISVVLTVNALPQISWGGSDTLCLNNNSATIPAATPAGGTYSGSGVTGNTLTVGGPGSYTISYSYTDSTTGCSDSMSRTFDAEVCVGIAQLTLENSIRLYPNPAGEMITVESDLLASALITPIVYDINGNVINVPFTRQSTKLVFDLNNLSTGVYSVKLIMGGTTVSKRFIKAE